MKKLYVELYLKAKAIWCVLSGDMVTYLPLKLIEKVGYIHIENVSKDNEELLNREHYLN